MPQRLGDEHADDGGEDAEQHVDDVVVAGIDGSEPDADADEAAEGCLIAVLREHEEDRREEGKARAEVGRDLPLAEHEVEDRADAVEQEDRGRVDLEENIAKRCCSESGIVSRSGSFSSTPMGRFCKMRHSFRLL